MRIIKRLIFLLMLLPLTSCKKESINCGLECGTQTEELLFQTGFAETVLSNGEYHNAEFSGTDPDYTDHNDWDAFSAHGKIGYVEIGYEDGTDSQRKASIVDDPDSAGNKVLQFQIFEPHIKEGSKYKGRIQLSIHDNNCIREIYQKIKLKLHPDLAYFEQRSDRLYWFTLFEFWNNGAWTREKYPFRVSVNLNKEEGVGSPVQFRVKSDYKNCRTCEWKEVWGETATSYDLVYGEWMELELYIKEGDANNGRFYLSVTLENGTESTLFDIQGSTQHPEEDCADGFTHFEAMKMYMGEDDIRYMNDAGKALSIYWDDWQLFVNKAP